MMDFLVVPDRDEIGGFRLPSVLRRALDTYARCYSGGDKPTWPQHEEIVGAVLRFVGEQLEREQAGADERAAAEAVPYIAIANSAPIPEGLPPALFAVIDAERRSHGWDECGQRLWPLPLEGGS